MILFAVCDFSPFVLGAEAIKWIETVELPVNILFTMSSRCVCTFTAVCYRWCLLPTFLFHRSDTALVLF